MDGHGRARQVPRWGLALIAPSAATVLKLLLDPWIGADAPFLVYFAAVTVSAWYGGLGPGLGATAYGAALATVGFALGRLEAPPGGLWLMHALAFVVEGALISALCAALHRAQAARLETERVARAQAEAAACRSAFLVEAGAVLSGSLDYETTLAAVVEMAVPRLSDWCAVDIVEEDGTIHRVTVVHSDPAKSRLARELARRDPADPKGSHPLMQALRSGRPLLYPDIPDALLVGLAHDDEHLRIIRALGLASAICVPLVARGRVLGALSFVTAESGRRFGEDDRRLALDLAHLAALAVDNARLHEGVRRSEARKSAILETALDAVVTVDHNGRVIEFNVAAERMFGYARAEALGRSLASLIIPPALRARHAAGFARYLATGESRVLGRPLEMTAMRADGSEFPVELAITRIAAEGPPLFTGYIRDITERRQAAETARRAEALRSVTHLANAAGHEISNPLAVIMGNTELLLADADERTAPKLQRVLRGAQRIEEIVAGMRSITRLEVTEKPRGTPPMLDLRRSSAPPGEPPG